LLLFESHPAGVEVEVGSNRRRPWQRARAGLEETTVVDGEARQETQKPGNSTGEQSRGELGLGSAGELDWGACGGD